MSTVKLGKADENFFKQYDRKFIQLNRDTALLLHIFTKDSEHSWEDIWLQDLTGVYEKDILLYEEAAKQFIDQLEGQWCRGFLQALRNECDKRIQEDLEKIKNLEKLRDNENNV